MRVLLVSMAKDFRGGERQALILLRGLRDEGIPATLAAPPGGAVAARATPANIPVLPLTRHSEYSPASLFALRRVVAESCATIVHLNDGRSAGQALWLHLFPHRPLIVTHRRAVWPVRVRWAYAGLPDGVIAISGPVADSLIRRGVPRGKVQVIRSAVDPHFLEAGPEREAARRGLGLSPEAPVFLYAAALSPEKGHELLLSAFERVRRELPEALLLLAGGGALEAQLKRRAGEGVRFLGVLPQAALHGAYRAADVFVFAGGEEGLGTASLEAQACGLPVVAVASGGVAETIRPGVTGLLAEPTAEALAGAMLALIRDRERLNAMGEAARSLVAEEFSPAALIRQTIDFYRRLERG